MNDKIKCPNCDYLFDVEDAISGQVEAKLEEKFREKTAAQAERFRQKEEEFLKQQQEFEALKERENELFKERLQRSIEVERAKINEQTKEQFEAQLAMLRKENESKKEENKALKAKELQILQREQQLKEKQEEMQLELKKQLLEEQTKIEQKAREKEREALELREREYQKQLDDQRKLIEEMKRKAEQGSMQLQGEVQELAIEEYLAANFPFDGIEEIKKGQMGADCIQHVNTRELKNCGTIQYESKRTKAWSNDWIAKFKKDMQSRSSTIGVIVTEVMPPELDRLGMLNGVWVCTYQEFKGLSKVLRESLIMLRKNTIVQEGKGDKMGMLYDFLTGNEFKMQVESIVEGFTAMKAQLDTEKRVFQRQWKEREKQIDRVINSTVDMYGSIRGIGGTAMPRIDSLELPDIDLLED